MQTEKAELYFRQGNSDKVYYLQLENIQDQWSVQAQWGRRGSTLQSDVKVSSTTYEEAKRVYDRILREKTGKGYQISQATANGNAAMAVGLPATKEHSGHTPELLTPIEEPDAVKFRLLRLGKRDKAISQYSAPVVPLAILSDRLAETRRSAWSART